MLSVLFPLALGLLVPPLMIYSHVLCFLSCLVTDSASLCQFELFIQVLSTCHNSMLCLSSHTRHPLPLTHKNTLVLHCQGVE